MKKAVQADAAASDGRSCKTCRFAVVNRAPDNPLHTFLVCKRYPPSATMFPMNGGVSLMCTQPTVTEQQWCFEYQMSLAPSLSS